MDLDHNTNLDPIWIIIWIISKSNSSTLNTRFLDTVHIFFKKYQFILWFQCYNTCMIVYFINSYSVGAEVPIIRFSTFFPKRNKGNPFEISDGFFPPFLICHRSNLTKQTTPNSISGDKLASENKDLWHVRGKIKKYFVISFNSYPIKSIAIPILVQKV